MASDPGMHPGYVLLSNGRCCDDTIRLDLGMTAELAAWWQHNRAAANEVITVGAITELPIPVDKLRVMHPVRQILAPDWAGSGLGELAGSRATARPVVSGPMALRCVPGRRRGNTRQPKFASIKFRIAVAASACVFRA